MDATNIDKYAKDLVNRGFDEKDPSIQFVERNMDLTASPVLENGWAKADGTKDAEFAMTLNCRNIILVSKDSGSPAFGKADVYVDDKLVLTPDPLVNGWDHTNPQIILNEEKSGEHRVRIVMHQVKRKRDLLSWALVLLYNIKSKETNKWL